MRHRVFLGAMFVLLSGLASLRPHAAAPNRLRGAVLDADGVMAERFSIQAKALVGKPELVQRKRLVNGTFDLTGLGRQKYQLTVTAPQFISSRMDVDFGEDGGANSFRLVI